ncbi:MAG: hypothetical protein BMS9Abin28_1187 [Anaerolineae bacterium]|nr:MAG: hypothetical protein BMS9Abin28_1187 [Anaerolineae bacterium]
MFGQVRAAVSGFSQRWGFEAAVLRANRRFDRDHPEWSAALFDDHFLRGRAAPILARYLDGPASANPDELAEAWMQQLWVQPDKKKSLKRQAIPMATRYLLCLEEEVQAHRTVLGSIGFGHGSLARF